MALFETHCFGISLPDELGTNRREALKRFNCFFGVIHRPRRKCYMANVKKNRASDEIGGINSSNDQIGAGMSDTMKAVLFYGMAMFFVVEVLAKVL